MKINRTLRYGGYATVAIAAVIAIVAGINLLVDKIPWRADMTFERFFTLSDQTQSVLASLKTPISVLELWEAGKEDPQVVELVHKYETRSRFLHVRQVDPYRNPLELKKYEVGGTPPAVGSLVFDTGRRFKVLKVADMYVMTQDPDTGEQVPTTFVAESAITNAIAAVTAARDPVVYFLTGHGEKELPQLLSSRIRAAFYDVRELTVATNGVVPGDADIVVDVSPRTDYTPLEEQALVDFLRQRGGKLLLMTDLGASAQPNAGRLLEAFGLAIRPWLVVERAAEHMLPNQPYVLIPSLGQHEITAASQKADMPVLFPVSQVLEKLSAVRRTVTIDPLLATSDRAYAKVNINDESGEKRPGDHDGPFVLAAAVTDSGEVGEKASRMVVMASSHFLFPSESMGRLEENENFFLSCLAWLQNRPELISIPPRTIAGNRYAVNLSAFQFLLFGGIAVILIPGIVFAAGLFLWLRRRHK